MHTVQHISQKFGRVMLLKSNKLRSYFWDCLFDIRRGDTATTSLPDSHKQLGVGGANLSLGSFVFFVLATEEVLSKRSCSHHALKRRIHKASVSNVLKADSFVSISTAIRSCSIDSLALLHSFMDISEKSSWCFRGLWTDWLISLRFLLRHFLFLLFLLLIVKDVIVSKPVSSFHLLSIEFSNIFNIISNTMKLFIIEILPPIDFNFL